MIKLADNGLIYVCLAVAVSIAYILCVRRHFMATDPPTFSLGIPSRQSAADLSIESVTPSMVTDQEFPMLAVKGLTMGMENVRVATQIALGRVEALLGTIPHSPSETGDVSQQAMFQDIDATLTRLENGIAAERTAMDGLLDRLIGKAA